MTAATKNRPATDPEDAGTITTRQMRQLHALLRDHGITTDKGIHDYLATEYAERGWGEVESRKQMTATQAAAVIADLENEPVARTTSATQLAALRAPFAPEAIGKLPRSTCRDCSDSGRKRCDRHQWVTNCPECRGSHSSATMHIDYVGHADVTDRLLQVDPEWTWEPAMRDQFGQPSVASSIDRDGNLWINLTVLGVTRPGVGDGKNAKEKIGDALRNAAMRFGVALDLWAKGDREWAHAEKTGTDQHPDSTAGPAPQGDPPPPAWHGPTAQELLDMISQHAITAGTDLENITAKFRGDHGGVSVDDLLSCPPQLLADLEASIASYLRDNPPAAAS